MKCLGFKTFIHSCACKLPNSLFEYTFSYRINKDLCSWHTVHRTGSRCIALSQYFSYINMYDARNRYCRGKFVYKFSTFNSCIVYCICLDNLSLGAEGMKSLRNKCTEIKSICCLGHLTSHMWCFTLVWCNQCIIKNWRKQYIWKIHNKVRKKL